MSYTDKATALLVTLNRLTSQGKVPWSLREPPRVLLRGTDDVIPLFMQATYKGERFGIYQQRYQQFDGEHERHYWSERVVCVLMDVEDRVLYAIADRSSALYDLFEAARRQVSNIDGILDGLLAEDGDGEA
jgi:hypothetical protein